MAISELQRQHYKRAHSVYKEFMKTYPFTINDIDGEEWRDIEGYDGKYQISNYGRVKSFKYHEPRILKPALTGNGYLFVTLYVGNVGNQYCIHRLVAKTFILNIANKSEVNHIDGCKFNNFVGNLEWTTCAENKQHAVKLGLLPSGTNNYNAKLSDEQVQEIRDNPLGLSGKAFAKKFAVCKATISYIQRGKIYCNVVGVIREKTNGGFKKIPDKIRQEIKTSYRAYSREVGAKALARKYNLHPSTILRIVNEE